MRGACVRQTVPPHPSPASTLRIPPHRTPVVAGCQQARQAPRRLPARCPRKLHAERLATAEASGAELLAARAQEGLLSKVGVETGPLVAALPVPAEDDVMITTARGVVMRLKAESIRLTGRVARGTRLITLDTGDTIHNVMRLDGAKDDGADAASPSDTPDEA